MPFGREARRVSPWKALVLLVLIGAGVSLVWLLQTDRVKPLFVAAPTPTRTSLSFAEEGKAYFSAGDLRSAIQAYSSAVQSAPNDSQLMAELARIQTYYSAQLATAGDRRAQLTDARVSADGAVAANPDNGYAHAIRALAYDWSATDEEAGSDQREAFLTEALNAAVRAVQLEPPGSPVRALALAFRAEVLVDQQRFAEALDSVEQAVALAPDSMDAHRVYGTVAQNTGLYRKSIDEFSLAADINPNLTFLYVQIGANYRRLRDTDHALEFFDRAAKINKQLKIEDPTPYIAIGRTYLQAGEFFIAAKNVEQALLMDEANPDFYGFLGIVYFKARNYESAEDVLRCAVKGCSQAESQRLICQLIAGCDPTSEQDAVAPLHGRDVPPRALDGQSLEAYYTFGSVLAFNKKCDEAEGIFRQLLAGYGGDPIVAGIVAENRAMCAAPASAATPTGGPTPTPD
jgi:tetratricopeptide (TPR) repeat protein